ncbi:MAG: hypothetical protein CMM93_09145 [Rickettsiales bacterium]|nr:hypothetical protein [Rickettsiales bacterium]MAR57336.1 hypothetical protein [Rickettsiales bacterium]|tara:strand:- start:5802 stop:6014 length:213 start_codon:yes stop_codon:yes gene_type:complete
MVHYLTLLVSWGPISSARVVTRHTSLEHARRSAREVGGVVVAVASFYPYPPGCQFDLWTLDALEWPPVNP